MKLYLSKLIKNQKEPEKPNGTFLQSNHNMQSAYNLPKKLHNCRKQSTNCDKKT